MIVLRLLGWALRIKTLPSYACEGRRDGECIYDLAHGQCCFCSRKPGDPRRRLRVPSLGEAITGVSGT